MILLQFMSYGVSFATFGANASDISFVNFCLIYNRDRSCVFIATRISLVVVMSS